VISLPHSLAQPEFVAPLVAVLAHPNGPEASGKIFEAGAGFVAEIRWERSKGAVFKTDASFTPSAVSPMVPLSVRNGFSNVVSLGESTLGTNH
jgi:multifunctional beta-oxidation protein